MANNDIYRIKARAVLLGITLQDVCDKMRDIEGVNCKLSNLSRARTRDVKTEGDLNILAAADRVLKRLEEKAKPPNDLI